MSNVVEFKPREKKRPVQAPSSGESYFFMFENVRFSFGGAFSRDIVEKINANRDKIEKGIDNVFSKIVVTTRGEETADLEEMVETERQYLEGHKSIFKLVLDTLKTAEDLDRALSDGSETIPYMSFILGVSVATVYSEFDIRRMVRDNWMHIDATVEELMQTNIYNLVRGSEAV